MKKIIYAVLSLMPLLFLMGCSEDDKVVEPGIQLGETEVIFDKAADSKEITVTVDTGHPFTATWSNEGTVWGEVVPGEGSVKIFVNENANESSRSGSVLITTIGDVASKMITVHQNGRDVTLSVLPDFIKYNQLAASKTFEVTTDATTWSVTGENDWLTVSLDRVAFNEVIVTVAENMGDVDRTAKLIVTAGGSKKEVIVTQTRALDLILPYLVIDPMGTNDNEIKANIRAFEEERGSSFIVDAGMMNGVAYRIPSKNFPEIRYVVMGGIYMIIQHPNNYDVLKSPELRSLIEENDFEYIYTSTTGQWDHFWRESGSVELRIDHGTGQMEFYPSQAKPVDPSQEQDYPTFTSLPKPYLAWSSTKAEIIAWENTDGSTLKEQFPVTDGHDQFVYSTSYNDPRKEFERVYWIKNPDTTPEFMQTMYMYKDFTLAYYLAPAPHNDYRLTREFRKLLSDSGYVEIKQEYGDTYYFNATDNLRIFPSIVEYPVSDPVRTLWITIQKGGGNN